MEWVPGTVRGKVYVPKVEEEVVTKKEYDSDDEDDVKTEVTHNSSMLDEETNQALMAATAGDIQDIADILGVTFQEHCMATPLKVRRGMRLYLQEILRTQSISFKSLTPIRIWLKDLVHKD